MIQAIRRRLTDMRVLSRLCRGAEACARDDGQLRPGSEHFVLAALSLPDATAARALAALGLDADAFRIALRAQRRHALEAVGMCVQAGADAAVPLPPAAALFEAQPSGAELVRQLATTRHGRRGRGLAGADVLLAVAEQVHSPAARAFRTLQVDAARLRAAALSALG